MVERMYSKISRSIQTHRTLLLFEWGACHVKFTGHLSIVHESVHKDDSVHVKYRICVTHLYLDVCIGLRVSRSYAYRFYL